MSDLNHINHYLKKVLQSKTFSKSVITNELLKYLVSQSLKGEIPKEDQISLALRGNSTKKDQGNNTRVYILNLRKKLEEYYSSEGKNDAVKISIPKGSYQVVFKFNRSTLLLNAIKKYSIYVLLLSLIFLAISISLQFRVNKPLAARHFIWNDLYDSESPTLIILGDH